MLTSRLASAASAVSVVALPLFFLVLLILAAPPTASADTLCPSYGSYANLCSESWFGWQTIQDCSACCAKHAQETICDCTDPSSESTCNAKANKLESECYAKCDAVVACVPSDPGCYFAPVPPGPTE